MTRKEKHDLNLHIALVGLSLSILTAVIIMAVYFATLDNNVHNNTNDIKDIKRSVHSINQNVQGLRLDMTEISVKLGVKGKELHTIMPVKVAGGIK